MAKTYTSEELAEIVRYCLWKEPRRQLDRGRYFNGEDNTPELPNWAFISRRNLWTSSFAGLTMVVAKELIGSRWVLYLGGDLRLGEPGTLQEVKDSGTAILVAWKFFKENPNDL